MKVEEVSKMAPLDRFFYWIKERHLMHRRRSAGAERPWTDDEILHGCFFTNPYRENDKVTVWFRETVRDPLRDDPKVIMATIIFRWFNYIPTGEFLLLFRKTWGRKLSRTDHYGALEYWDEKAVCAGLDHRRDEEKRKIFTGAFMVNSPKGRPKNEGICWRIQNVWEDRQRVIRQIEKARSLEAAHKALANKYDGLGGFMAYEVITDLRHTALLEDARDIFTWCNPGPGCIRGLLRLDGREDLLPKQNKQTPPRPKDWLDRVRHLVEISPEHLPRTMPRLEMREIEHSLCEWDKYERARLGDGQVKRKYPIQARSNVRV